MKAKPLTPIEKRKWAKFRREHQASADYYDGCWRLFSPVAGVATGRPFFSRQAAIRDVIRRNK